MNKTRNSILFYFVFQSLPEQHCTNFHLQEGRQLCCDYKEQKKMSGKTSKMSCKTSKIGKTSKTSKISKTRRLKVREKGYK